MNAELAPLIPPTDEEIATMRDGLARAGVDTQRTPDRPRLYLDLDGVLADFDRGYIERFGKHPREVEDAELWRNLDATPDFFDRLHPMPDALQAFSWLRHLAPTILTACPRTNYHEAAANKRRWVRRHLGGDVTVLPCMGGTNKPVFMHAPGDVLVDDFEKNVRAWRAAGGVGILHRGDWTETLEALAGIYVASHLYRSSENMSAPIVCD